MSTSNHVLFCLLYKQTNGDVFDKFLEISEDFERFSRSCLSATLMYRNIWKFSKNYQRLPKITEDNAKEDTMMFQLYSSTFKYSIRELLPGM